VPVMGVKLDKGFSEPVEFIESWNISWCPAVKSCELCVVLTNSKECWELNSCSCGGDLNDGPDATKVAQGSSSATRRDELCVRFRIWGRWEASFLFLLGPVNYKG
jgi:hypothetical protein